MGCMCGWLWWWEGDRHTSSRFGVFCWVRVFETGQVLTRQPPTLGVMGVRLLLLLHNSSKRDRYSSWSNQRGSAKAVAH